MPDNPDKMASTFEKPLAPKAIMAYCMPIIAVFFLFGPIQSVIPGIYAKYFGLEMSAIATVVLLSRFFDAITDPFIGYLSDLSARRGYRKAWVAMGGVMLIVSAYFLYNPPSQVSFVYFLCWFLAFYLSLTVVDIPHVSMGATLAPQYQQRTRLFAYRVAFVKVGTLLFYALPLLPWMTSREFTPETLSLSVSLGIVLMVVQ